MFLVSPCPPNLFFPAACTCSSLVTVGLEGFFDDIQSVGLALPSSILCNTLTLLITEITFQYPKMYRHTCSDFECLPPMHN